jgi:hypothetical protein
MRRNSPLLTVGYFLGSAILVVMAVGLARALIDVPAGRQAKTLLDERIETARQIRRALATPVPPPEPLEPITAKPAREQRSSPSSATTGAPSR